MPRKPNPGRKQTLQILDFPKSILKFFEQKGEKHGRTRNEQIEHDLKELKKVGLDGSS